MATRMRTAQDHGTLLLPMVMAVGCEGRAETGSVLASLCPLALGEWVRWG